MNRMTMLIDGAGQLDRDSDYHRKPIIIHDKTYGYFAEFETISQLENFAKTLGFTYELKSISPWRSSVREIHTYELSHRLNRDAQFWKISDLPEGAKPIRALSNGSIVVCYYINDGQTITIFRPNPNAKEVYKPLSTEDHIAYQMIFGKF